MELMPRPRHHFFTERSPATVGSFGILDLARALASVSAANSGLLIFWPPIVRLGQATPRPKRAQGWPSSHWRGDSTAWTALAPATRRQRELVFRKVAATAGAEAYTNVTRQTVMAGLDRRGATPFAAKTFLKALRGLFRWAAENSFIERDPTEGVRIPL
jgi:hypothetical protein